ncbi:hypothetical protein D9758_008784 [Tetrapyrgos nigripes]|uniref:Protein kinase domain-containing protein n=1 Tax=Tetrapyrgos nigripes TaxID=182062 RepID=A0A8H5D417_9AGAR|nr:hypothetical protein D9758_008784 [Tetrapyrgos nigripes]
MIRPEQIQVDQNAPLGRGRTKNAYKATMESDVVAVKILSQDASPQALVQRYSLWEPLQHPNVLRVLGVSEEDADPLFIVSELHENGDVRSYLDQNPNDDRPQLALDVALGMQYLHSRNIIHGGLKTSDILVKGDGHACIADYGVTEIQSSKNSENHRYFSPEAWKGIFTSTPPFGVLSEKHIYRQITQEHSRPDRPDHALCVRRGLTDTIWGIIEEGWDKEPRLRPTFDIIVRMWMAGTGGYGGGAQVQVQAPSVVSGPIARRDSLHSVASGPPAYELEARPPLLPLVRQGSSSDAGSSSGRVRPSLQSPPSSPPPGSPPPSFSPNSAISVRSMDKSGSMSKPMSRSGSMSAPVSPPQVHVDLPSSPGASSSGGGARSNPSSPGASSANAQFATSALSVGNSGLPSPALSESFSKPVQPLRVPTRPGPGVGGGNGSSYGQGSGYGGLIPGSRASVMSGLTMSDRESISSSGSGYRHPNSMTPRRRRTLIIQNRGGTASEPPSAPASIDSFAQRLQTSQRILEEDENTSTLRGSGNGSGSGSGTASASGSRVNVNIMQGIPMNPNLSSETQLRLATLSQAHQAGYVGGGGHGYEASIAGMSEVGSMGSRSGNVGTNPVLLAGALQAEVKAGRKEELVDDYLVKVYHMATASDKNAQKLITAGLIPTLILLLKTRAATNEGEGLDFVLMALGALAHDTISSNTIFRTNTTTTLIELFTSSYSDEISALSIWCLTRICRSTEIAQGLIKAGLVKHLLTRGLRGGQGAARLSAWCIGALIHTDAIADTLADMAIIPDLVDHLRQSSSNPSSSSEDICSGLFAIARMARSIKLSKNLAKAGCIDVLARHLNMSTDPRVLDSTARTVGCLMRPNSSDMSRMLLDAGVAAGLARMPSVLPSDEVAPLASFAFAIQRFSCAEWGGGTRKALVEAGVVDSLLAALRTAADEPYPQVHIELALAVSFLGDVGGKDIRKEIINAGGIKILKRVGAVGSPEVSKACNMAATSITGNIWTRNAASAKTAMTHNWSGGCPEYHPPCPVFIEEDEDIDRLADNFSEGVGVLD